MKKFLLIFFFVSLMPFMLTAKSMFAIGNMYDLYPLLTDLISYDLQYNGIQKQETLSIPSHGSGPYDLCMESNNKLLFVSFRGSNVIECVDAGLFKSYGFAELNNISNPAAIQYNDELGILYALERNTKKLFTYSWFYDDTNFTLQGSSPYYTELENITNGQDLEYDSSNDLIYVADSSQSSVHYFSAYDLSHQGYVDIFQKSTSIAVDHGKYLYSATDNYGSKILQYDLVTSAVRSYYLSQDAYVVKLEIDDMTGNLFVSLSSTSGINTILVLNEILEEIHIINDEEINNPAGMCVPNRDIGYNPYGVQKDDGVFTWISPNKLMRYTISYQNQLNYPLENVIITDWLPSDQHVSVHNISDDGFYDQQEHTITWDVGTLLAGGIEEDVWVEVRVLSGIQTPDTLVNFCTIGNDLVTTTKYVETFIRSKTPVTDSYFEPNPYNPELNGEPGIAHLNFADKDSPITKLLIYDLNGELVIKRENLSLEEVSWNGKNEAGKYVANGVYFMIVFNEADEKEIVKIAVLR
ncbi:MAG: amidophosphoribosyltransferase [Candidatus Cloacimonetes bacterium]|nr:amidophosphoribosyltransferase [Candidatus Cloacimonadota bacterium]